MDEDEKPLEGGTDPTEAREFSSVVSGLRASYPKEKMEEISTSFCFICLLHLANERGLKLETGDNGIAAIQEADEDDFNGGNTIDEKVGNIWGVKVSHVSAKRYTVLMLLYRYTAILTPPPQHDRVCVNAFS
jgi:condensin complex subunit 2